jgi:hypothetical protein
MDHDYAQRRRVALAIAITVIAVPAAFLLNNGGSAGTTSQPGVTLVGTQAPGGSAPSVTQSNDPAATDALGTAPVGYLSGTTAPGSNEPARIAIPREQEGVKGTASFSSTIESTLRCQAKISRGVPFNATITVTNLDNSRSVQCIASIGGVEPDDDVILAPDTFAQIADLTDAPVPVEITWAPA